MLYSEKHVLQGHGALLLRTTSKTCAYCWVEIRQGPVYRSIGWDILSPVSEYNSTKNVEAKSEKIVFMVIIITDLYCIAYHLVLYKRKDFAGLSLLKNSIRFIKSSLGYWQALHHNWLSYSLPTDFTTTLPLSCFGLIDFRNQQTKYIWQEIKLSIK